MKFKSNWRVGSVVQNVFSDKMMNLFTHSRKVLPKISALYWCSCMHQFVESLDVVECRLLILLLSLSWLSSVASQLASSIHAYYNAVLCMHACTTLYNKINNSTKIKCIQPSKEFLGVVALLNLTRLISVDACMCFTNSLSEY